MKVMTNKEVPIVLANKPRYKALF